MSAHDEGYELFKKEPELALSEVYWRAQACGYQDGDQHSYVEGYRAARRQHDDYKRESGGIVCRHCGHRHPPDGMCVS